MEKPILLNIIQKTGLRIDGARVQWQAPEIAGFLAIESQDVRHATQYIALDNIASFTVLNEEICNITSSFPVPKIKTKRDDSL
jgi:hypothetical protein